MYKAALTLAVSTLAASVSADTLLFDFGAIDKQTTDTGWNNVTYTDGNNAPGLTTVIDDTGATVAGVSLVITDQFYTATQPTLDGTNAPTGDAAGLPTTATNDFFIGHTGEFNGNASTPNAAFKLTGLDAAQTYSFTFFASRVGVNDNRETSFVVTGENQESGLLQATHNNSNLLILSNITPDSNNEILISLSAGPNNNNSRSFYYINSLQVDSIPEPGAMGLLTVTGLIIASRRRRHA